MGGSWSAELEAPLIGYKMPGDRSRMRGVRQYAGGAGESGVAFDPTSDEYDFLVVFARPGGGGGATRIVREDGGESVARITWKRAEDLWFQAVGGDEEDKVAGVAVLMAAWRERFRVDEVGPRDSVPFEAFQDLVRDLTIRLLTEGKRGRALQCSARASSDGRHVYCLARAPKRALERMASKRKHKLRFKAAVDPGRSFWLKGGVAAASSAGPGERAATLAFPELLEDGVLYDRPSANELLEDLYVAGKIEAADAAVFDDEEIVDGHWSRRIHVLERHADRVPVRNLYPAYAAFDCRAKCQRHLFETHATARDPLSLFLPKDRMFLTKEIMDEIIHVDVLVEQGVVLACFPLHEASTRGDAVALADFAQDWVFWWRAPRDRAGSPKVSDQSYEAAVACARVARPWAQPLRLVHAYFGESVALYFAWAGFYGVALCYPCAVCLGASVGGLLFGDFGEFAERCGVALFFAAWAAWYAEAWGQEETFAAVKWGSYGYRDVEETRPQFVGDADCPRKLSPITNLQETWYPKAKREWTQARGFVTVFGCVVLAVAATAAVFLGEQVLNDAGGFYAAFLANVVLASQMILFSRLYASVAEHLNDAENYATQSAYVDGLISKKVAFEVVNSAAALLFTLFGKFHTLGCVGPSAPGCVRDARALMATIFLARYVTFVFETFGGASEALSAARGPKRGDDDDETEPAFAVEFLDRRKDEGLFADYEAIVLQMGLVVNFSIVLFIVPPLAALEVLCQLRADAYRLCYEMRRPVPQPADRVGAWTRETRRMGALAALTNAGVVVYATAYVTKRTTGNERLVAFLALFQVLHAVRVVVAALVPPTPRDLDDILARNAFVVKRHTRPVFYGSDSDGDGDGNGATGGDFEETKFGGGGGDRAKTGNVDRAATLRGTAALSADDSARLAYLEARRRKCNLEINLQRRNYARFAATEEYRSEAGVSYSKRTPDLALGMVTLGAAKGCELPNFKGSYLGRFPLVSADVSTSDHLSERSRT